MRQTAQTPTRRRNARSVWAQTDASRRGRAADDVSPRSGMEYTFRIAFDYSRHVYSIDVRQDAEWVRLSAQGGVSAFPVAVPAERVSRVIFKGDTLLDTLWGEYAGDGTSIVFR